METSTSRTLNDSIPPAEIIGELETIHRRELRELSDVAFMFLLAANGDIAQAEQLFDTAIDLMLEGGVLSMWRYRIVLASIREGL